MTEKHTPGPWEIEGNRIMESNPPPGIARSGIASIHNYLGSGVFNARLIAAAPEMLKALQALNVDLRFRAGNHSNYYAFNENAATAIDAAIEKATGEE